jgi:hypothetical protein
MPDNITIKIAMVGPSGVGKTSLLASMADRIDRDVEKLGFRFHAEEGGTKDCLDQALRGLKSLATGHAGSVDLGMGPDRTEDERSFHFKLTKPKVDRFPSLKFVFSDVPGGWYNDKAIEHKVRGVMNEADAFIVTVDSVALMEANGLYNEKTNASDEIVDKVVKAVMQRPIFIPPPLVMVVATKAETYFENERLNEGLKPGDRRKLGERELRIKLQERYGGFRVLKHLSAEVKGCTVETVGNILFNHLQHDTGTGKPVVTFRRIRQKGYESRFCSLPMRMILAMIMRRASENLGKDGFVDFIFKYFGSSTKNSTAREELRKVKEQLESSTSYGIPVDKLVFDIV